MHGNEQLTCVVFYPSLPFTAPKGTMTDATIHIATNLWCSKPDQAFALHGDIKDWVQKTHLRLQHRKIHLPNKYQT